VEDYVRKSLETSFDPRVVGEEFKADRVVYVELLNFQIRDPTAPDFLRGRIEASVTVHDLRADPDQPQRYELAPVTTVYPEDHAVLYDPSRAIEVRHGTYTMFSEMVARKFYEYERPM